MSRDQYSVFSAPTTHTHLPNLPFGKLKLKRATFAARRSSILTASNGAELAQLPLEVKHSHQ